MQLRFLLLLLESDLEEGVAHLLKRHLLDVNRLVVQKAHVFLLAMALDELACFLEDGGAAAQEEHLPLDLLLDIAFAEETHDVFVESLQVLLDHFEFALFDEDDVVGGVALLADVLAGLLHADFGRSQGHLLNGHVA